MIKEVRLPEVGENIESGEVVKVLVSIGEEIKLEQPVVEVETDKAIFEVPSTEAGIVKEILIKEGEEIKVNGVIIKVETAESKIEEKPEPAKPEAKEKTKPEETSEADKMEKAEKQPESEKQDKTEDRIPEQIAPASPSVRRLARELGVDLQNVTGTGSGDRITDEDVKAYAKGIIISKQTAGAALITQQKMPDFSAYGEVEIKPFSKVRRITAETLSYAWNTVPHVTQFDKADITELEEFRQKHKGKIEEAGGKLTLTAFLIKVAATALKVHPQFNASVDMARGEIIYKKYYHIGVAVDTDRGLLVPVIRDVDKKSVARLAVELTEISKKARDKKIMPDELQGGNFTVSNLGGIAGANFTPIVYWPQVAILGVGRSTLEPVYIDGRFKPRLMMPLGLSYDHRIIDGADGARFIKWVVDALEDPFLLALED
ncbi:MAG: 2-oxo acid dehydrogenase subunit E2 [Candidatus Zixiibacteriota bacterium]|nr:MAG: 2-oxo acid dehydrogenase subunit E2 [candidate division Zixibacteria bacterium]